MASETRSRPGKAGAAFTLVELLLVVALMLMLAGAVIINFGSLDRNARLEEGASQVETLFRYARGQAASTGRQVRIVFGSALPVAGATTALTNLPPSLVGTNFGVQVLWEPDPVGSPGKFELFSGAELLVEQVNDLVKVQSVRTPGAAPVENADLGPVLPFAQSTGTNAMQSAEGAATQTPVLTCYPDGSSDSLEVVLTAANGEDPRIAIVTLSGLTGASRHRLISDTNDMAFQAPEIATGETRRNQ